MPKWFTDNKTKIAGAIIVLIGFLQAADQATVLSKLMGENGYSIFNMVMGAIVIVLGFWNTSEIAAKVQARQGGYVRPGVLLALLIAVMVALVAGSGALT